MIKPIFYLFSILILMSCGNPVGNQNTDNQTVKDSLIYPEEKHFASLRQLTFSGDNAEAYWSFDDSSLVFQAKNERWGAHCDQIYQMKWMNEQHPDSIPQLISTGLGRTTCSYFMPGDTTILYASTHEEDAECPHSPAHREDGRYVWPVYDSYDIYIADLKGNIVKQLTNDPGYDAEATVSPDGKKIVFTSLRSGDLELYTMNVDGSDIKQITFELGYDGGAFFSHDSQKLIFRSSRPKTAEEVKEYKDLLAEGLVMPTHMELYICNADGSELRQLTTLGKANWSPFFHPSDQKVIFSSNHAGEKGWQFNLYMINIDGTGLERITYDPTFDAFPVFSYSGKYMVFSSNRNNKGTRDTNLFVAEWKD